MAKIAVLGFGGIGAECVFEAKQRGHDVIVISRDAEKAFEKYKFAAQVYEEDIHEGKRNGYFQGDDPRSIWEFGIEPRSKQLKFCLYESVFTEDYVALQDVDYVISTVAKAIDHDREFNRNMFLESAPLAMDIAFKMKPHLKSTAVVITPVNPVELQTEIYRQCLGLPAEQVIGAGTMVDTTRMEFLLRHRVLSDNQYSDFRVVAPVLGLHRNNGQVFTKPQLIVNGQTLPLNLSSDHWEYHKDLTRVYGWELVKAKREQGYGEWDCYGPALACLDHIDAREGERTRNLVVSMSLSSKDIANVFQLNLQQVNAITGGGQQVLGMPVAINKAGMIIDQTILDRADTSAMYKILQMNQDTLVEGYAALEQSLPVMMYGAPMIANG